MKSLLFEIGTEEIPAGYIQPALQALADTFTQKLAAARISHGTVRTYGTPRRLAVRIADVAEKQASITQEMIGPPERVGYDDSGKPTVALIKFAEKAGVPVFRVRVSETPKGRYLTARKTEKGRSVKTVLKILLPEVLFSIPFPKSMKWSDMTLHFARPIQTILALLGSDVIPFSVERLKSGRITMGHPFMAPGRIKIASADQYPQILDSAYVTADMDLRRQTVQDTVRKAAADLGGAIRPDAELTEIVTNLVEYPVPVAGSFDKKYLELPEEVLITAMREHQKYFAVVEESGRLMPHFIAVNNTCAKDMKLVAKGHERVLRARLEDAMFFYRTDEKTKPDAWVEKLHGVLFQAKLGSVYEKTKRVQTLGIYLARQASPDADLAANMERAAWLCKADLVSHMVVEFPKLQGIMGRVYAALAGEPETVARAIEEHYRPVYSGAPLPETRLGALLAIADKMDSICGCFSVGLIPTGASDPYALRRQAIGILQIIQQMDFGFSVRELIETSAGLFAAGDDAKRQAVTDQVSGFLRDRIANMLVDNGYQRDVIAAVTSVSVDSIPDVRKRVIALDTMKQKPDFQPLAVAFKRAVNILKKADDLQGTAVNPDLFEEPCEAALNQACADVRRKVMEHLDADRYEQALVEIATLRDVVDAFFDGVLVMAKNPDVKNNRLALLTAVADLFKDIADFSKISV